MPADNVGVPSPPASPKATFGVNMMNEELEPAESIVKPAKKGKKKKKKKL